MQYIYKITNIENNKIYIGLTNDWERRKREHFNGCKTKYYIDQEISKNPSLFTFEVIDQCESRVEIEQKEIYWIEYYNSYREGYNKTSGGFLKGCWDCQGEKNPRAQFSAEDVANIRYRRMQGERMSDVYNDYKDQLSGDKRAGFSKMWLHDSWPEICEEYKGHYPPVDTKYFAAIRKNTLDSMDYEFLEDFFKWYGPISKYNEIYKTFKNKIDWESFQETCKKIVETLYGNKSTRRYRNKNGETDRRIQMFRNELKNEPIYIA